MLSTREIFQKMVDLGASDLYLRINAKPRARIDGQVEQLLDQPLSVEEMNVITNTILSNQQFRQKFQENLDLDFVHVEPGIGRFRLNFFMQRGTPAIVARHVKDHVGTFEDLHLPADLCKLFCEECRGLFLVCGPAGNGKSTTIASMIEHINATQARHIITIEDPIEYLFKDQQSIINQRELELDVASYPAALKHVTQQSPDIIYIGNIRDEPTMRAAVTATELGCFVMSTFHTVNSVQTLLRIINFFPPHQHDEIRMQLSVILKGSISLRLLPRADGQGRIPAYETMVVTPTIARLIRENRINEIQNYIDEGHHFGMQSFRQSLVKLVKAGTVELEAARRLADSKDEFDLAIKGIKSKFD